MIILTEVGKENKEILDANIDTTDDTHIPTIEDIISDIEEFVDDDGDYYNCWGVTDNYNSDRSLCLTKLIDFDIK